MTQNVCLLLGRFSEFYPKDEIASGVPGKWFLYLVGGNQTQIGHWENLELWACSQAFNASSDPSKVVPMVKQAPGKKIASQVRYHIGCGKVDHLLGQDAALTEKVKSAIRKKKEYFPGGQFAWKPKVIRKKK